jgi:hypothetical protein
VRRRSPGEKGTGLRDDLASTRANTPLDVWGSAIEFLWNRPGGLALLALGFARLAAASGWVLNIGRATRVVIPTSQSARGLQKGEPQRRSSSRKDCFEIAP